MATSRADSLLRLFKVCPSFLLSDGFFVEGKKNENLDSNCSVIIGFNYEGWHIVISKQRNNETITSLNAFL